MYNYNQYSLFLDRANFNKVSYFISGWIVNIHKLGCFTLNKLAIDKKFGDSWRCTVAPVDAQEGKILKQTDWINNCNYFLDYNKST